MGFSSTPLTITPSPGAVDLGAIQQSVWTSSDGYGLAVNRPSASAVNAGFTYCATDTDGGTIYRSDGTNWDQIAESVLLPAGSVGSSQIVNGAVGTSQLANAGVTAPKLDPSLVVSYTPGAKTIHQSMLNADALPTIDPSLLGTADDHATIQGYLDAANAAGGGRVVLPVGTFKVASPLVIYSGVILAGQGRYATVIQTANGANVDAVQTYQYASLTGTGSSSGAFEFGLSNLSIDGNKANNTSGRCLSVYGYAYAFDNVELRDAAGQCFASEYGPGSGFMEAHIVNLRVHDGGSDGIDWQGPHDSTFVNLHVSDCAGYPWHSHGANGGGSRLTNYHSWGCTLAVLCEKSTMFFNADAESCQTNDGAQVKFWADDCQFFGRVYGIDPAIHTTGQPAVGIEIGNPSGASASRCIVVAKMAKCSGSYVSFDNDGGGCLIDITGDLADYTGSTPTAIAGTPAFSTMVRYADHLSQTKSFLITPRIRGLQGTSPIQADKGLQVSGGVLSQAGGLFEVLQADGTTKVLYINPTSDVVQIANGNDLGTYSDDLTTRTFRIKGATGFLEFGSATNKPTLMFGAGAPAAAAAVGSIYLRSDGGTSTTLYVKESGTGTTGWVAK